MPAMLLVTVGSFTSLFAAELAGRILDADGRVVPGASVRLYERNASAPRATTSNGGGEYAFTSLTAGEYLLEAESNDGALSLSESLTIGEGGERRDITLQVRGPHSQILVTASATPMAIEEIGKAASFVDQLEINRRNEITIGDALRLTPGLRVTQNGGPGSMMSLRFRGMRNHDSSILIDGFRFRDATSLEGDVTAFVSDLLTINTESVEVIRGSGSSLYGSHAMGGVVNIRTDNGGGRPHGEIRVEGGGLGFLRGVARAGGGVAENRLLYSGGVAHLNVTSGVDGFDPARNTSGQGFARWSFTPKLILSGRVFASDGFAALNESPTSDPSLAGNIPAAGLIPAIGLSNAERARYEDGLSFSPGGATFIQGFNDPDNRRTGSFFAGALRLRQELSSTAAIEATYSGVGTDRSFRDGPSGLNMFDPVYSNASLYEGRTDTAAVVGRFGAGSRNLLTVGYEFERESYDNFNTDENPDPSLRPDDRAVVIQRTHAFYVQDQMRWLDGRLQLLLSGRAQSARLSAPRFEGGSTVYDGMGFSAPKGALTGDASLSYFVRSSGTKLRAHAGNSFRNPSAYERFGSSFFMGSFTSYGDPTLRPERSWSIDGGIDQYFAKSKARLSGTFFYMDLQERIHFDFSGMINPGSDPYGRFGGYLNLGGGTSRGVEASAAASAWRGFDFTASYTFTNSEFARPTAGVDFFRTLGVSDHMVSFVVNQRIGRLLITTDFFAASEYPFVFFGAPRPYAFAGPKKVDVVAGYDLLQGDGPAVRLYGKLENVFDRTYYENGFQAPGLWGVAGLEFRF